MARTLTLRELNRATLDRQLLSRRHDVSAVEAIGRIAGLQAQEPWPPYLSLWARLSEFDRDELTRALEERTVVRSSLLRGTQHMVTAEDYLVWRPLVQPVFDRVWRGGFRRMMDGVEPTEITEAARALLAERPMTRPELRRALVQRWPDVDPAALTATVQLTLPLVHPPPNGTWGSSGATPFALAESWLGRVPAEASVAELITRYLAAFGPASTKDIQAWCGLTRLREVVERLDLVTYRDEDGRVLYDLPDAELPEDTALPVRFLPSFDNVLLAHDDRRRMMADHIRKRVIIGGGVESTVLVDGTVAAMWLLSTQDGRAVLTIEPLVNVDQDALTEEALRLLDFCAPEHEHDVRFVHSGQMPAMKPLRPDIG
ncbi:winged helix DNA-binding protein [Herbihabitans rhizosphaerae]|uniref:Winged helix DNA-binding protein n=1 Tax=Herbihabitans rhizosphaerae TaxID=1872711 RepID=A0A4Q7KJ47_9PSEU|nr:winged helix DNA-binding domain-containing protein [Herbihabitans rhizosphaerae]RZS34255.1 winged helix DNA-binding protein [Herbihabitans rhizosphaerae]